MYSKFEDLTPETIDRVLKKRDTLNVSPDVVMYILQLDDASKLFKGNVTQAAKKLQEKYGSLTVRTAKERVYDAIKYLHAGENALPSKYWYSYYADKYESIAALYAIKPALAKHSLSALKEAERCRIKASENEVPYELLKTKVQLVSPDVDIERLAINGQNISQSWKQGLQLINDLDISETDKARLIKEFENELGIQDGDVQD